MTSCTKSRMSRLRCLLRFRSMAGAKMILSPATREKEGFTKSTFNLYGRDIRETAKKILLDAHAAHGDTYALRRQYADRLEKLLNCTISIHRKINSNKLARDRRRARQCRCIYKKQHKAMTATVSQNTRPIGVLPWV